VLIMYLMVEVAAQAVAVAVYQIMEQAVLAIPHQHPQVKVIMVEMEQQHQQRVLGVVEAVVEHQQLEEQEIYQMLVLVEQVHHLLSLVLL